jgi:hypothetical protein
MARAFPSDVERRWHRVVVAAIVGIALATQSPSPSAQEAERIIFTGNSAFGHSGDGGPANSASLERAHVASGDKDALNRVFERYQHPLTRGALPTSDVATRCT